METEFKKYRIKQDRIFGSDFDKFSLIDGNSEVIERIINFKAYNELRQ